MDIKVLVISHMYPSLSRPIAGIFVHEQVQALVEQGCEVMVVSAVPVAPFPLNRLRKKWRDYSLIPSRDVLDGVEIHYPRYLSFPANIFFEHAGLLMHRGIRPLIEKIHSRFPFDIIHAHVAVPDGDAALKLKEEYKRPLVVTVHGADFAYTLHRNKKCNGVVKNVLAGADRVITVSERLKKVARENMAHHEKVRTIHNGVTVSKLTGASGKKKTSGEGGTILSVSNLIKLKGIDYNLHAVAALIEKYAHLRYIVVGDGVERNNLERLAASLKIEEHVCFKGELPHDQVMELMNECDIFALPSWNEAFGVVYIEAMAAGKPAVACRGAGIEDIIEDRATGMLVEPRNLADLTAALDHLLASPREAQAMGARARELVLEKLTWEENARKNIEVYKEVLPG